MPLINSPSKKAFEKNIRTEIVQGKKPVKQAVAIAYNEKRHAEGAPELLKKEMPTHRHAEKLLAQNGVSKDDPDYYHHLNNTIKHLRQFGNIDLINKQGVAEEQLDHKAHGGKVSTCHENPMCKGGW